MNDGIFVANAPCSWGLTDDFPPGDSPPGPPQVLEEIALAGYAGTELGDWGFLPTDAVALREELSQRDLLIAGAFVPVRLNEPNALAAGEELALRTARLLADSAKGQQPPPVLVLADEVNAARMRVAGRATAKHALSNKSWNTLARGTERIAQAVREATGLRVAFHHHAGTYVETSAEVTALLERTDPDLIGLCLDTGHYIYGGGDALDAARRFADRIWHVHAKDCAAQVLSRAADEAWDYSRAVQSRLFCELGEGVVDLPSILSALRQRGYHGWIVVEDEIPPGAGVPLESAQRDREFLRRLGF